MDAPGGSKRRARVGLASADRETRHRVAVLGGRARALDIEGLRETGRKGGAAVKRKYGHEYFVRLGRRGGARVAARRGREYYSYIGRLGGAKRARTPGALAAAGRKGAEARWRRRPNRRGR